MVLQYLFEKGNEKHTFTLRSRRLSRMVAAFLRSTAINCVLIYVI